MIRANHLITASIVSGILDRWRSHAPADAFGVPAFRRHVGRKWLKQRRGQALVEFALVALVLYLLLAATIEFGRMLLVSQTIQSAAEVAAREIARTPLPATATFDDVVKPGFDPNNPADPQFLVGVATYSEDFLAIDVSGQPAGMTLFEYLDTATFGPDNRRVPIVNKMLAPAMIISRVGGTTLLRYPGALVTSSTAPSGYTVKIPVVTGRAANSAETITWRNVVEGMQQATGAGTTEDMFPVTSASRGLSALRINYPFQAASLVAFQPPAPGSLDGNLNRPFVADDGSVTAEPLTGTPVAPDTDGPGFYGGPYGGAYGLGELGALNSPQLANGLPVRPFRRVVTAQAVARREVFGN
jgi:hypothetical protein